MKMKPFIILNFGGKLLQINCDNAIILYPEKAGVETFQLMNDTIIKKGADENRVYVVGFGKRAKEACKFVAQYNNCIAALLLCAGSSGYELADSLRDTPIRLLSLPNDGTRDFAIAIRASGSQSFEEISYTFDSELSESFDRHLEWLLTKDLQMRLSVRWIQPGLWNIESGKIDSFYLVTGKEKSLVIDTGMGRRPILPLIKSLTDLPIIAAFTHVHLDHIYHAYEFEEKYISPFEESLYSEYVSNEIPNLACTFDSFCPIGDGDIIHLGSNSIEIIGLPGHTPGSLVFIDHVHQSIFTGDSIGSGIGVLMSLNGVLPLSEYLKGLIIFRRRIEPYNNYSFYGGHRIQEHGESDGSDSYHPLCIETVDDMITLCQKLKNGESLPYQLEKHPWTTEDVYYIHYQRASIWTVPSQIHELKHSAKK